jgi:hypothetical protein
MSNKTENQYWEVIDNCKNIFLNKTRDYGTSWRLFRLPSITDQIYIKANRIRTIEQTGFTKVDEGRESEFMGIINYCIIALIQLDLQDDTREDLKLDEVEKFYTEKIQNTFDLMLLKNHDYGEAWRSMRIGTFSDMILVRIKRIKQIEENEGETIDSEGIDANYQDMINYAIFAMIKINEANEVLN